MPKNIAKEIEKSGCGKAELTARQNELYEFIFDKANWRPPSYFQMKNFLNYTSDGAVNAVIGAIRRKGWELPVWRIRRTLPKTD